MSRPRPPVTRFVLQRPAVVRVNVWEQSPTCLFLGRYDLRGARGANVLVLRKRVGGHRLVIGGTYHLVGAAGSANVLDVRVRLARVHDRVRIRRSGLRNVCSAVEGVAFNVLGGFTPSTTAPAPTQTPPSQKVVPGHGSAAPSAAGSPTAEAPPRGPLPTSPTSRAVLFVLLALAVALLAGAALPGPTAAGGAVARHRAVLTSAGITLMVAAALVVLLA